MPINTGLTHNRAVAEERVLAAIALIAAALQLEPIPRGGRHRRPEVNEVRTVEWTADSLEAIAARLDEIDIVVPVEGELTDDFDLVIDAARALAIEELVSHGIGAEGADILADAVVLLAVSADGDIATAAATFMTAIKAPEPDALTDAEASAEADASDIDVTDPGEADAPASEPANDHEADIELTIEGDEIDAETPPIEESLTPQQKAARTRAAKAANQAATS